MGKPKKNSGNGLGALTTALIWLKEYTEAFLELSSATADTMAPHFEQTSIGYNAILIVLLSWILCLQIL